MVAKREAHGDGELHPQPWCMDCNKIQGDFTCLETVLDFWTTPDTASGNALARSHVFRHFYANPIHNGTNSFLISAALALFSIFADSFEDLRKVIELCTGERQEHLGAIVACAGAGQRRRMFREFSTSWQSSGAWETYQKSVVFPFHTQLKFKKGTHHKAAR